MKMEDVRFELPNSWVTVKLGDFVENEKGKKPKSESKVETDSHTIPYVDIQAFEEMVIRSWTDGSGCRLCYETDFLMVWDGSRSGLVGKGINGALGSTLVRIYFPSMVNDYAFYFLQSKYQQINTRAKGVGIPHVDPALLWNYDFPIAPLSEQRRIVAKIEELFSELDKGVEYLKTAQAQLKVYRQALLKHAFEGKLSVQWREQRRAKQSVAPAKAGAQPLNDMDSRPNPSRGLALRGNDEVGGGNDKPLETAADLLKRIQQERAQRYQQQLTDWESSGKQGSKPKPPKSLPPLTAEELAELPELPEGWGWFSIGNICQEAVLGKMLDKEKNKGELKPYLRNINVRWGKFALDDLLEMRFEDFEFTRYGLEDHDLIVCEGGEPGRCAVWRKEFGSGMQIQKALHRIRFTSSMNSSFVQMYFELCASNRRLEKMFTGTTIKHLTGEKLTRMAVPICSIAEQIQILLVLESRFSEIDQLDQTITTSLQQAEALRQSILKKAFSGQLVPQDPNDEPASELLARIKAERESSLLAKENGRAAGKI